MQLSEKELNFFKKININYQVAKFEDRSYFLLYGNKVIKHLGTLTQLHDVGGKILIISHQRIKKLYGSIIEKSFKNSGHVVNWAIIPVGEKYKNLDTVNSLYNKCASTRVDKSGAIVALGGGVVQDISNYLAATYMRGVPFIQIPTTILSQADVGIGGCAVDHSAGKSLIGTFYQPKFVLIDSFVLESLSQNEVINGISEIINKVVCLGGLKVKSINKDIAKIKAGDYVLAQKYIILSNKIKKEIIEQDEIGSKNLRYLLDWGHTITYALEKILNYSVSHGWALGIGMYGASKLSHKLGYLSSKKVEDIKKIITNTGLPIFLPKDINIDQLVKLMNFDQKTKNGKKRFVLLSNFGDAFLSNEIDEKLIKQCLSDIVLDK